MDGLDSQVGAAYVFESIEESVWVEHSKLEASDAHGFKLFGGAVAIDRSWIVIGAEGDNEFGISSGAAYMFKYNFSTWDEQTKLLAEDGEAIAQFGVSVDIEGETVLVGAESHDGTTADGGAAYVFQKGAADDEWSEIAYLYASDSIGGDRFGTDVSMSGVNLAIGADRTDDIGLDSGSVYFFEMGAPEPEYDFLLETLPADPPYTAGAFTNFRVSGLTPGDRVALMRSSTAGESCPPALGGACLDMSSPSLMRMFTADADGEVNARIRIPRGTEGASLIVQALAIRGPGGGESIVSNPIMGIVE